MTPYDFVRYLGGNGAQHAVRKRGLKYHHLVVIGHPISVVKVPIEEEGYITPITAHALTTTIETFLAAAGRCGITDAARQILTEAGEMG